MNNSNLLAFKQNLSKVLKYLYQQSMYMGVCVCVYIYIYMYVGIRPKDNNIKDISPLGEIKTASFPGE